MPKNITARPTTDFARENIFNVLENFIDIEGARVADLFSGTGAVAVEFLSRGAAEVTAVEKAATQANFIRKVAEILDDPALKVVKTDVFRYLATAHGSVNVVFADPPYDLVEFDKVLPAILASKLTAPGTFIILEHGKPRSYTEEPYFIEHREYGSVNFSIFRVPGDEVEKNEEEGGGDEG